MEAYVPCANHDAARLSASDTSLPYDDGCDYVCTKDSVCRLSTSFAGYDERGDALSIRDVDIGTSAQQCSYAGYVNPVDRLEQAQAHRACNEEPGTSLSLCFQWMSAGFLILKLLP